MMCRGGVEFAPHPYPLPVKDGERELAGVDDNQNPTLNGRW